MNFEIINPGTKKELLSAIKGLKNKNFRFGAGYTDLLLDLKRNPIENLTVINLANMEDQGFTKIKRKLRILNLGAGVTAQNILTNEEIKINFNTLHEAAFNLASTQIRQVATIGGNLCTASPSGDISCALMALGATCEILSADNTKRRIPVHAFFTGVRSTALRTQELLYLISLPENHTKTKKIFSRFLKIGTRKSMECSVVSIAYHIQTENDGNIISAGIAIGASAPTIRFTESACQFLLGKNIFKISDHDIARFAELILSYASPISDIRATAWYRKEALYNISKGILEDHFPNEK